MKKLITLTLALVMILSLAVTAFAAPVPVTINDSSSYTGERSYTAYKLMTASVSSSNTEYAYVVNPTFEAALETALGLPTTATSDDIIGALKAIADRSEQMLHFADELYRLILDMGTIPAEDMVSWTGKTTNLEQAYWLIADTTDLSDTEFANSLVMVDTVDSDGIEISNKPKSTTTDKKIDDENDSLAYPMEGHEDADNWQDVADYDIGDQVPYSINIDCANDIAEYDYYSLLIADSVEKGLTYNPASFKLYVNTTEVELVSVDDPDPAKIAAAKFLYKIETDVDSNGDQTAQRLYVYPNYNYTYTDDLGVEQTIYANTTNGGDLIGYFPAGTPHDEINSTAIRFDYTCELNENAVIGIAGNPNKYTLKFSNNPYDFHSYGKTPEDTVIALTFQLNVNKVDPNGNALKGATFSLWKFYEMDKPTDKTDEQLIAEGWYNHPSANTWGQFVKVNTIDGTEGSLFEFKGIDDGFYKLVEDVAPAGYNKIEPIEFRVNASHVTTLNGNPVLTSIEGVNKIGGTLTFTPDTGAGTLTTSIENRTGSELPSTGGVGTTMFYVLGSIMVLGAAVVLVTKKRMAA